MAEAAKFPVSLLLMLLAAMLLCLTTTIQNLYLESLRLRARELPALAFFKDQIEDRIGLKTERGALVFSLWKHSLLAFLGILSVAIVVDKTGRFWESTVEASLASWAIMMVAAYVVPQMLYRKTSGAWLSPLVPFIKLLVLLMTPLVALLGFLQSLAELNEPEPDPEEANSASDDIEALIEAGAEGGLIEEEDKKLIQSVVEFGDKTVREVMTPRPSIVAIQEDKSIEEFRQLVANERYSRIPVYRKDIDDIVGFVHLHDLITAGEDANRRFVKDVARPIKQVPETKPVKELMDNMRAEGTHMAVVIDEYGNTAGLATMEDLVEEILGEIRDEHEPNQDVTAEGDGKFVMAGSYDLDHLKDLLGYERAEEMEATTVGGLATEWFGRVPHKGEVIEREGIRLEVLAGHDMRVEKVRVSRAVRQAVTTPAGGEAHA